MMSVLKVSDLNLYVEQVAAKRSASAQGVIVFLHGLGSSTRDWQKQMDTFSPDYNCIAIDLRGHGQSDKPDGPYSIEQMATDVSDVLIILNVLSAHLVGLSMGAQVAMQLALDYPAMADSLTVINSPASMRPRRFKDKLSVIQRKLLVRLLGMHKVGKVLAGRLFPGADFVEIRETFAARWAENDPAAYRASLNAILKWDVVDRLPELALPVLVVAASDDYTPLESKQLIAENAQSATLVVIENSRHATPVERPDAFNDVLGTFLKRL